MIALAPSFQPFIIFFCVCIFSLCTLFIRVKKGTMTTSTNCPMTTSADPRYICMDCTPPTAGAWPAPGPRPPSGPGPGARRPSSDSEVRSRQPQAAAGRLRGSAGRGLRESRPLQEEEVHANHGAPGCPRGTQEGARPASRPLGSGPLCGAAEPGGEDLRGLGHVRPVSAPGAIHTSPGVRPLHALCVSAHRLHARHTEDHSGRRRERPESRQRRPASRRRKDEVRQARRQEGAWTGQVAGAGPGGPSGCCPTLAPEALCPRPAAR